MKNITNFFVLLKIEKLSIKQKIAYFHRFRKEFPKDCPKIDKTVFERRLDMFKA